MKTPDKFILIDDDLVNNSIFCLSIRMALGRDDAEAFHSVEKGINYIKSEHGNTGKKLHIALFLDINLPVTSGWDALEIIEALDENIKKQLTVFMLSASFDTEDKKRALKHPMVYDYIEKPLLREKIEALFK